MATESEQNPLAPHMASLLAKLTEARWIERSVSTPKRVAVDWTPEGLKNAKRLSVLMFQLSFLPRLTEEELACLNFLLELGPQGPADFQLPT
jgi:hypothetical protein